MSRSGKPLSAYQQNKLDDEQKEYSCGITHVSIEEALFHAEQNLGFRDAQGSLTAALEPLLGSMYGEGTVVGWQAGTRKRFRLDFEPDYQVKNAEAAKRKHGVNKGPLGVHVNEEDFTRNSRPKICHATESSLRVADLYWRKWSSKYGQRGLVTRQNIDDVEGRGHS